MLQYRTIEMSDPRGKPKVYFSCRPEDFEQAFDLIAEDIFRHMNCAIWYDTALQTKEVPLQTEKPQFQIEENSDMADEREAFDQM